MRKSERIITIVLDSVGIGSAPDATAFGDQGADTLGHLCSYWEGELALPQLTELGLGRICRDEPLKGVKARSKLSSAVGKMREISAGKDSMDGHWEMMGVPVKEPLDTFPNGFPYELVDKIEKFSNRKVLLNQPYSGTQAIKDYGEKQIAEGGLIVYTSGDSVIQVAAHEAVVPVDELYRICRFIRFTLDDSSWNVGRVIARPFVGQNPDDFERTANRHDFSMVPKQATVLDLLNANGVSVCGIGKINDIFSGRGIDSQVHTTSNLDGLNQILAALDNQKYKFVFANLVDFDSNYGHRRDAKGYGIELEQVDQKLRDVVSNISETDLLIVTADHGNDPTFRGNDHTREYVPLLVYSTNLSNADLGIRETFSDLGATILDNFGIEDNLINATSFLNQLR
ncbi:phosphopentomutase [Lactobacillus sp. HMSC068F07]|nr:phosphopentomutase [Lactobacillus sp. HMSC068F07]